MQVFKAFLKVIKKYTPSIILYLVIYSTMLIIIGSFYNKDNKYTQKSYGIYVVNDDNSELSKKLVDYLNVIHKIKDIELSEEDLKDSIYYEDVTCAITIPAGFGDSFTKDGDVKLEFLKDDGIPYGMYVENQVQSYMNSMAAYLKAGYDVETADSLTIKGLDSADRITMSKEEDGYSNMYSTYLYFPFVLLYTAFMSVLPVVLAFNRKEIKERMNISSMSITKQSAGLILSAICVCAAIWMAMIIVTFCFIGTELFSAKGIMSILNSFVFLLVSVAIMSLASNFNLKGNAVSMLGNIIALSMCFLGGIFVPMEFLGKGVLSVGKFLPTYWYAKALAAIDTGATFKDVYQYIGIEVLFGIACLAASLVCGKLIKQKKAC